MRSPQGQGAGPRGAIFLSLVLGLAALASPALAGHHLESESAAEQPASRILAVSPDDHVMLIGGSRVLNIEICDAAGTNCKPAKNAKATVKPKSGLKLSRNKGPQIKVTGNKQGVYELSFKQGKATGSTTVTVNEAPNREPTGPTDDEYRIYISPSEVVINEGQSAALMVWGCLLGPEGRLGANELPDGVDDLCVELDILDLVYDQTLPMTVLGPQGSTFFVTIEPFPAEIDEDQVFAGVQAVTEFGSTLASIIAKRAAELEEFGASNGVIGDTNGNGMWDREDWRLLWKTMFGGRYDPVFDVDGDGVLDEADWIALTGDAAGMPTPIPTPITRTTEQQAG